MTEHTTTVAFTAGTDAWQATCTCGWCGPLRVARNTARLDAHHHERKPE